MTLCKCGCGKEAGKRKQFLQGHYSKYMSNLRKQQHENPTPLKPIKETIMDAKPETIIEEQPEQPEPPYEPPQYQPIPPPNKIRLGIGKIQVSMESVELNMNELIGAALFTVKDLQTMETSKIIKADTDQEKSTNSEVNKLHNQLKKEAKHEQPPPDPAQPLPAGC